MLFNMSYHSDVGHVAFISGFLGLGGRDAGEDTKDQAYSSDAVGRFHDVIPSKQVSLCDVVSYFASFFFDFLILSLRLGAFVSGSHRASRPFTAAISGLSATLAHSFGSLWWSYSSSPPSA